MSGDTRWPQHATAIAAKAYAERHYGLPYARLDAAARAACLAHATRQLTT